MRGVWVGVIAGLGAVGCRPLAFSCDDPADCTQSEGGVCVDGTGCAYPDPRCDSGLRYSDYAEGARGQCVPVDGSSTTSGPTGDSSSPIDSSSSGASSSSSSSGEVPADCDAVDCSGHGTCAMLDGAPHCACDETYYRVGVECLEDPCDVATCFFVDFDAGDDANEGTRAEPWKNLARIADQTYSPGDAVLLRRGVSWAQPLRIGNLNGTPDASVTIGAYGPREDGFPDVDHIELSNSSYATLRDIAVFAATVNNVIRVSRSDNVLVRGCHVDGTFQRALRVDDGSSHTVLMANHVFAGANGAAIAVIDTLWTECTIVGDHHWVAGNIVELTDTAMGHGISAEGENLNDVKVVGNRVLAAAGEGIVVTTASAGNDPDCGRTDPPITNAASWVVGNTAAEVVSEQNWRSIFKVRRQGAGAQVSGNVALGGQIALVLEGNTRAIVSNNTFTQDHPLPLVGFDSPGPLTFVDNLCASGSSALLRIPAGALDQVEEVDRNWYVPMPGGDCEVEDASSTTPWSQWSEATMLDAASVCESGPVTAAIGAAGSPEAWGAAFFDAFVPPSSWERCADPAGAFDCDGNRIGTDLHALPDHPDNDGRGWEGPVEIRLRWPFKD